MPPNPNTCNESQTISCQPLPGHTFLCTYLCIYYKYICLYIIRMHTNDSASMRCHLQIIILTETSQSFSTSSTNQFQPKHNFYVSILQDLENPSQYILPPSESSIMHTISDRNTLKQHRPASRATLYPPTHASFTSSILPVIHPFPQHRISTKDIFSLQ